MQIQFLGATQTVTGSKFLLTDGNYNLLVDAGLFQGLKALRVKNWQPLPIQPSEIDAVILSHAHIDHSGYLPLLVRSGFKGPVYCSDATRALCEVLLPDSGHLQEEDAELANRLGYSRHNEAKPLYTVADAKKALEQLRPVPWNQRVTLSEQLSFDLHRSGHIIGASLVRVMHQKSAITFTGDIGRLEPIIMNTPVPVEKSRYLILETTYGNRSHVSDDPFDSMADLVRDALDRGGSILIPAFAVGRTQKVLYLLYRLRKEWRIPESVPIYLDSPMAIEATRLFFEFTQEQKVTAEEAAEIQAMVRFVTTPQESKKLVRSDEQSIIISASGMATGGRELHHLKKMLPHRQHTILFVGYQAAGTRGQQLTGGAESVKIHGEKVEVRAQIRELHSLSAHADATEIIEWLRRFREPPAVTFLVHGEPLATEAMRQRIEEELGWQCHVPDYKEIYQL